MESHGVDSAPFMIKNGEIAPTYAPFSVPCWFNHNTFKTPWLYVSSQPAGSAVAYTDIGDLQYVHADGTCPVPGPYDNHPGFVFNRPVESVHVRLENVTHSRPQVLWDATYRGEPGGPTKLTREASAIEGDVQTFIPFCFDKFDPRTIEEAKYRLTVESYANPDHPNVVPFKEVIELRPRPFCDVPVTDKGANSWEYYKDMYIPPGTGVFSPEARAFLS